MTDATESAGPVDGEPTVDADGDAAGEADAPASDDHRPGRPPLLRFFEALGFRRHARVGVVSGIVLAVSLYGFFVAVPSVAPGVRGRPESPLLFAVLGFVAAVATALFVTTALTVRTLAQAVASPPKWVRRGGAVATVGGLLWAAATLAGVAPAADAVRPWISVPVLLVVCGIWAAHTRIKRLGSPLDPVGTVLATAGVAGVHVAALLEPAPFLGAAVEPALTPFTGSVGTLAVGTVLLAAVARPELGTLADAATALSVLGTLAVALALTDTTAVSGAVAVVPLALAWVALGVALRGSPTPANWSPDEVGSLLDDGG
ncbi:DUF7536 family protein [Haloarchaeobius iranensis]|uniref:Uncharacterized protein n=1 Tax=Haloarchaeobius iranensis TaxID=996166 RepID=A0A1G9Y5L0_9EURY|nr:hypothetical protein [Haloarchaeobius iranensis]SDN04338.1 hypothetical protein SAMN05192554_11318 [Haloarchaeobius iranensis]